MGGKPELPEFHPAVQAAVQPPRIALPATPPPAPIRPAAEAPKRASGEKAVEPPKLKPPQMLGADEQALVSLSPTPTCHKKLPRFPKARRADSLRSHPAQA